MRIGLELFGAQSASRHRGVGRYVRNLAIALASEAPRAGIEMVFLADASAPADLVPSIAGVPSRLLKPDPSLGVALDRYVAENPDGLDILIMANPLEMVPGFEPPARPARSRRPRLAAVIYDLIPLLFPADYLRRWTDRTQPRRYSRALDRICQYDCLLSISEATRDDLLEKLGLPREQVATIGTGGDDAGGAFAFASEPDPRGGEELAALGLRADEPFVFSVAATDPRKNLGGLLAAFVKLPEDLRRGHRLAVASGVGDNHPEAIAIRDRARRLGVADQLLLTGPVSDQALRALYRRARAFVFPSRYEGFGLPVLEALRCGAAVLAGDHSSIPEVAGGAALLVNVDDPDAMAAGLARILTDEALARSLRERGPEQASLFTWERVARRTLAALEANAAATKRATRPASRIPGLPRIAMFSPLPPHPSGIADYVSELLPELARHARIGLFHDAEEAPFARYHEHVESCHDHRAFARLDRARPYQAVIYQMGNSPAHFYMMEHMKARPGIVVLHDLALASLHYERATRLGGGQAEFREILSQCHPGRAREYGEILKLWASDPSGMVERLTESGFDMNHLFAKLSTTLIVHSKAAAARLSAEHAEKTTVIPLGAQAAARPVTDEDRAEARRRLQLPIGGLIIGRYGAVHPAKLDQEVITAFAALLASRPEALMLVAGEEADGGQARRRCHELGVEERVQFLGRRDSAGFQTAIAAADFAIAARRPPTNGESSGALTRMLRVGLPTIVTDVGSFAEFPDHVVLKAAWPDEPGGIVALTRAMIGLGDDPDARRRLGTNAWEHVRAEHAWPLVAGRIADLFTRKIPTVPHRSLPQNMEAGVRPWR